MWPKNVTYQIFLRSYYFISILGSYTALITYVFNIGKPCNVIFAEFMSHMRLEYEDFSKIYNNVYATIENCVDKLHNMAVKVTECICWKT